MILLLNNLGIKLKQMYKLSIELSSQNYKCKLVMITQLPALCGTDCVGGVHLSSVGVCHRHGV